MLTVVLGLAGALAYGGADFYGGLAARRSSTLLTTLGVALVGLVGLALTSPFVTAVSSYDAWFYGAASGLAGAIGIGLLYGSLAIGPMSILSPATAFISAIVPVSVGLSAGEGGGASFYIALAVALVAVILVGFVPEKGAVRPRPLGLLMAAGSGTFIGFTVILIDLSPADSGLIPLLANRMVSSSALIIAVGVLVLGRVLTSRTPKLPGLPQLRTVWTMIVIAGILDVVANVAVIYGLRSGALSVVSVLIALYPAGTILLASVVLKERIALIQWAGLVLALVASGLLAL
ncbi:MAG: DMT family transporter [Microbacteriaceae bacterium]|nr:DMT family transporter [Microbacteriaceae bacterium]